MICLIQQSNAKFQVVSTIDGTNVFIKAPISESWLYYTAQKMKFCITNFFSKYDQIRRKLRIGSDLLKKSVSENFIFCVVLLLMRTEIFHQYTVCRGIPLAIRWYRYRFRTNGIISKSKQQWNVVTAKSKCK